MIQDWDKNWYAELRNTFKLCFYCGNPANYLAVYPVELKIEQQPKYQFRASMAGFPTPMLRLDSILYPCCEDHKTIFVTTLVSIEELPQILTAEIILHQLPKSNNKKYARYDWMRHDTSKKNNSTSRQLPKNESWKG